MTTNKKSEQNYKLLQKMTTNQTKLEIKKSEWKNEKNEERKKQKIQYMKKMTTNLTRNL